MLTQRQGAEPQKSVGDRDDGQQAAKAAAPIAAIASAPPRKMTFKEKHALDTLPQTIAKLEGDIAKLTKRLDDPALFTKDRAAFDKATADLAKAQAALRRPNRSGWNLKSAASPSKACDLQAQKKAAAERSRPPRQTPARSVERRLDNVDFCREVARDFETDFLFANGWLGPDLHVVSSNLLNEKSSPRVSVSANPRISANRIFGWML